MTHPSNTSITSTNYQTVKQETLSRDLDKKIECFLLRYCISSPEIEYLQNLQFNLWKDQSRHIQKWGYKSEEISADIKLIVSLIQNSQTNNSSSNRDEQKKFSTKDFEKTTFDTNFQPSVFHRHQLKIFQQKSSRSEERSYEESNQTSLSLISTSSMSHKSISQTRSLKTVTFVESLNI